MSNSHPTRASGGTNSVMQNRAISLAEAGYYPIPVAGIVKNRETGKLECHCQWTKRRHALANMSEEIICGSPGKHPTLLGWETKATRDHETNIKIFDPSLRKHANIGVATGSRTGLVVLDIDGEEGMRNLARIQEQYGALPTTITAITGSGGRHFHFSIPTGVQVFNSASKIAAKIDIRGENGQALVPPSKHISGGVYQWEEGRAPGDIELASMPQWLLDLAIRHADKSSAEPKARNKANGESKKSAAVGGGERQKDSTRKGWRNHIAAAGDGKAQEGFNSPLWLALLSFFGENGADADDAEFRDAWKAAFEAASKKDDSRGRYEAGHEYFEEQVRNARDHIRENTNPSRKPASEFVFDDIDAAFVHLNQRAASILFPGTHKFLILDGGDPNFLSPESAKSWLAKVRYMHVDAKGNASLRPAFPEWAKWDQRPDYYGTDFNPGGDTGKKFNLWQGFKTEAAMGDWDRILQHILCILCAGDVVAFEYAIRWLAQLLQEPDKKVGTAWVVIGEEGSGKSIFFDHLVDAIGVHAMQASGENDLFNHFNAHQANKVLIYADESPFTGNPQQDEMMKNAITSPMMRKTAKGRDTEVSVKDCRHWVFTMNPQRHRIELAVSDKSRRYFVTQTDECRNQQAPYFKALAENAVDGMSAMFHDLMTLPCNFDTLRVPYRTRAFGLAVERNFAPEVR